IRGRLAERAVVVLGIATDDGKAQLICAVSSDLADAGLEARPILHPAAQVVGGGAGGKGDLAQAGGKAGSRLDEALQVAAEEARRAVAAAGCRERPPPPRLTPRAPRPAPLLASPRPARPDRAPTVPDPRTPSCPDRPASPTAT